MICKKHAIFETYWTHSKAICNFRPPLFYVELLTLSHLPLNILLFIGILSFFIQ